MGTFIGVLIGVAILYVGAGFLVTYINAQSRDDEYKIDWKAILKWPRVVFPKR